MLKQVSCWVLPDMICGSKGQHWGVNDAGASTTDDGLLSLIYADAEGMDEVEA